MSAIFISIHTPLGWLHGKMKFAAVTLGPNLFFGLNLFCGTQEGIYRPQHEAPQTPLGCRIEGKPSALNILVEQYFSKFVGGRKSPSAKVTKSLDNSVTKSNSYSQ